MKIFLIIVVLICNQVVVYLESKDDAARQKRGVPEDHKKSAFIRALAWVLVSMLLNLGAMNVTHYVISVTLFATLLAVWYWLTFDPLHSRWTGETWWYTNKGPLDSIFAGHKDRYLRLLIKVTLVILFSWAYFKFLVNGIV